MPNDLLDRVMPTLRDTELRVLLVVVRQTDGWQAGPGSSQRKERDWLTQSQLIQRTGRASEAVSRAVETLVQAGLISVADRRGTPKKTADERRRFLGRLYYQLGSGRQIVDKQIVDNLHNSVDNPSKSEDAKANTTKETVIQKDREKNEDREENKAVDNFQEKPFLIRTKGWEKVGRR